ncbi:hypothetical protein OJAV_G00172440 [Oryzias javanicus]|uniref:RING-type domain-containing protein n=1 Tax=Oryzias javanicus TaxID=123683 RepID=A0A437CFF8_ORYJA|nr:hypothetical protein OJAV_G00172440 [Oryzias javanicus]
MEEQDQSRLEELLTCPVCQDIFRDPRQLPCGHSMCLSCLKNLEDHSSNSPLRCPDCRAQFGEVVDVQRSYALAHISEDYKLCKNRREKLAKKVYCDCCSETKTLAFKTCLKCEVSMCKEHVKNHLELPAFTGHPLVDPLSDLNERKCPQHEDDVLRYYCNSSRRYICNVCALESKQLRMGSEISSVLQRQLTDHLNQEFKALFDHVAESTEAISRLQEDFQHYRRRPPDLRVNGVTFILLFLWFIVLYYAYNYSVENQMLTETLEKQCPKTPSETL